MCKNGMFHLVYRPIKGKSISLSIDSYIEPEPESTRVVHQEYSQLSAH